MPYVLQRCTPAATSRAHSGRHGRQRAMRIRPGNAGEDGMLKRSKDGDLRDARLRVRASSTGPTRGASSGAISCSQARPPGMPRRRKSAAAYCAASSSRRATSGPTTSATRHARAAWPTSKDFDDISFIARIGVEKGKPKNDGSGENYADKNIIAAVITPDKKDWHPVEQSPPFNGGNAGAAASPPPSATPAPGVTKPAWAS